MRIDEHPTVKNVESRIRQFQAKKFGFDGSTKLNDFRAMRGL